MKHFDVGAPHTRSEPQGHCLAFGKRRQLSHPARCINRNLADYLIAVKADLD